MSQFAYTAIPLSNPTGAPVSGRREAPTERALRDDLRSQGLIAVDVRPVRLGDALRASWSSERVRRSDGAWFLRTLRLMLGSSVPVEQGLATMQELAPTARLKDICARVRERLRGGASVGDAVASVSGLARPQHLAVLRAGHESGRLTHALDLIDRSIAMSDRVRRSVTARLAYPAVLLLVGVVVLWLLSTAVMPKFASALESMGGRLPLMTSATLAVGGALAWILPLAGLAALVFGVWVRSSAGAGFRARAGRWAMRLPLVREVVWHAQGAALTDTLATMLEGGADVLTGLSQAREVVTSPEIGERLARATRQVREGADLGRAFKSEAVLPPMIGAVLEVSVRSGDLAGGLRRAAEACLDRQERTTERLLAAMGPGVVVLLALMVGWVAYAMVAGMLAMNDTQGL
ncbi:MAG TPA: hypothetical protein DEB06_10175 [Phycisphaerales bacterium]|nr:hypothetical protein [Phycisphaerales bacterium]